MRETAMMRRLAVLVGTALVAVLAVSGLAWAATALAVTKTVPASGATEVARTVNVKAYFNHDMKASTFTSSTFKIRKQGTTTWLGSTRSVNNTISPTSTNGSSQSVATLNPNSDLAANTTYQVVVVGGSSGVKDLNGNALGANKSWTFTTVDTIAPAAPAITSPQENGFVGASFTLSGTAEPNATVEVLEGTTSKGTTQTNGSGVWSKALSGLSEGAHTYTARATDAAGNTSSASNARTVKVDTQAPSAPAITSPANNSYDNDGAFTISGTAEANSTVTTFEGTTSKGTVTADAQGNWSKALSGVVDGSHTYTAKATDAAGNISTTSNARTVKVDTTPPTVNNVSPANTATGVAANTDVTATFSDAGEMDSSSISGQTFTLKEQGSSGQLGASVSYDPTTKTATLNPSTDLTPNTTYTATLTTGVKDMAGNAMAQEITSSFTVEAPPSVTVTPNPLDFGTACLTTITKSVTITNNTASQVDLFPSVTSLAFSVASDELHIASGQSLDLPISWSAGGGYKQLNTGSLELKNASDNILAASDLKGFNYCIIDG